MCLACQPTPAALDPFVRSLCTFDMRGFCDLLHQDNGPHHFKLAFNIYLCGATAKHSHLDRIDWLTSAPQHGKVRWCGLSILFAHILVALEQLLLISVSPRASRTPWVELSSEPRTAWNAKLLPTRRRSG